MADYSSPFKTGLEFLDKLGVYEVLLPFLLIFTLVFAILEKTKAFGTEKINDEEMSKKNLNSMFAFVTSFLVVASSRLVATINEAVANMTILLLLGVCFLLLAGVFHTGKEEFAISSSFKSIFMIIMFIGIVFIFLYALKTDDGTSWFEYGWNYLVNNIHSGHLGAIILTIFIVIMMGYITGKPGSGFLGTGSENKKEE